MFPIGNSLCPIRNHSRNISLLYLKRFNKRQSTHKRIEHVDNWDMSLFTSSYSRRFSHLTSPKRFMLSIKDKGQYDFDEQR